MLEIGLNWGEKYISFFFFYFLEHDDFFFHDDLFIYLEGKPRALQALYCRDTSSAIVRIL